MRQIDEVPLSHASIGIFDEETLGGRCASSIMLKINNEHYLKLKFNYGRGTNMKAKLLDLWCLENFVSSLSIDSFRIYGDSLVIVNWDKHFYKLHAISLHRWCLRTKALL